MMTVPPWEKPAEPKTAKLKPKKVWQVGDKVFTDYLEAVRATTPIRRNAERAALVDYLESIVNWEGFTGDVGEIVDRLLTAYTIKPIKK